jgi:hypothetical protein
MFSSLQNQTKRLKGEQASLGVKMVLWWWKKTVCWEGNCFVGGEGDEQVRDVVKAMGTRVGFDVGMMMVRRRNWRWRG